MRHKSLSTFQSEAQKKHRKLKPVRVDARTVIFVPDSVSDKEAIANYLQKIEENHRKFDNWRTERRWKE